MKRNAHGRPWDGVACGLVALRVAFARLAGQDPEDWGLGALLEQLQEVSPDATTDRVRSLLLCAGNGAASGREVGDALLAYARALEDAGDSALAIDVYRTLAGVVERESYQQLTCFLRMAHCYWNSGALAHAHRTFAVLNRLAKRAGDAEAQLRAQMGLNKLNIYRGNLPLARRRASAIAARAARLRLWGVNSRALHDRSAIAFMEGQSEKGLLLAYVALARCTDSHERERIQFDIATGLRLLEMYEAAKYVYCTMIITAKEHFIRLASLGNLLEIATQTLDELEFQRCSQKLAGETLPPLIAANVQLSLAVGYVGFGNDHLASVHFKAGAALAVEHGFNQILIEAERDMERARMLRDLRTSSNARADEVGPPPKPSREVAENRSSAAAHWSTTAR